jgi:hypothetical protein
MHRFGSDRVADIKRPLFTYEFPTCFSPEAKARVHAVRLAAEEAMDKRKASSEKFEEAEALLFGLVLRVFIAFVEEGRKVSIQGEIAVDGMERECLRFLKSYANSAGLMDGSQFLPLKEDVEITDDVRAKFESSEEWKAYRRILKQVAEAQAAEGKCSSLAPDDTATPVERATDFVREVNAGGGPAQIPRDCDQAELARVRQEVVMPRLREKRWKRGRWVTESGVSKNSVYEYLEGKRTLSVENRKAMAEALDLKPEDLPD